MPFLPCISSFECISFQDFWDRASSSFVSFCFKLNFTSVDIVCHKFLEFRLTLSEKALLSVWDFKSQNLMAKSVKRDKSFFLVDATLYEFVTLISLSLPRVSKLCERHGTYGVASIGVTSILQVPRERLIWWQR